MTRVLNTLRKEPLSGQARSVVVFLHGYGANGQDLIGLADPIGRTSARYAVSVTGCARRNFGYAVWAPVVSDPMD